jgi:SWI/SNF-related matrix-associated actin-dependent regulator 1 of chromatin subfamily A|tara:strand:- start:2253 stop:4082 length:1830 start_codon:yes stop_codon:yes gene_type:complete
MLNIKDIKGLESEDILKIYEGKNPYINYMKKKYMTEKSYFLTTNQAKYVRLYHNIPPKRINKVTEITDYFSEQLQEEHKLKNAPKKILIETLLAESDKAIHVISKLYKNQKDVKLIWIPKTQLIDDIHFEEVVIEVDYEKYQKIDKRGWRAFKHQEEGIEFLLKNKKCILADDMGLGKTYQSIVSALEIGAERILIVCPSSLKINWMREIQNFCEEVSIIKGKHWDPDRFTIINYDILKNFHTIKERGKKYDDWEIRREIVEYNPDVIILDEAHFIKNHKSIRGKILKDISKKFSPERIWLLTGTPIANRPMDYYNLLSIIDCSVADNWVHYARTYCEGIRFKKGGRYVWVTKGSSNLKELSSKTKRTVLRRKKEDVLDLPDKLITPVYLELQNTEGYKNVWNEYLAQRKIDGKKGNPARDLVEMTLLRTFIAMETVPYTIEKTEEALELGKKTIIFCNFNDEMDSLISYFGEKSVCIRGGMSDKQKQHAVDRFQEDESCMVFIGQIKAAGVGITLTAAEIVIMNSLDWVPGNHEQAEDRAYRIGQNKTVNIYYMLIDETIDTLVWEILTEKKKVIDTIMGDDDIITEFINKIEDGSYNVYNERLSSLR